MPDDRFQATSTFNASSDHFDDPANSFLATAGAQLAALVGLQPGERVLDCACGTGHSAIPAAARVGPAGQVIAVDLAARLLELGRDKAARAGLPNIEFRQGDMERLALPPASFDAVLCGFGLFFAADMEAMIRTLWRLLRPGGRLGITTWGHDAFEPAHSGAFAPSLAAEAPALAELPEPWCRADTPFDTQPREPVDDRQHLVRGHQELLRIDSVAVPKDDRSGGDVPLPGIGEANDGRGLDRGRSSRQCSMSLAKIGIPPRIMRSTARPAM